MLKLFSGSVDTCTYHWVHLNVATNPNEKSCDNPAPLRHHPWIPLARTRKKTSSSATSWKPHRSYLHADIPADLVHWLLDPASLTLRLQQLCGERFHVRVVSQGWGRPRRDEAQALGMEARMCAIIRQVQLMCADQPWIYARTVIPATSLRGRLQRLAHLGTRPLGAMLFADPGMRRGVVELARIRPGQELHADATQAAARLAKTIWGRRSVFRIVDKPLLVSEIFLPGFPSGRAERLPWKM
jgi:chorismate--pyruvate lyase